MKDDPKKKKLDGKRISQQPWEQAYQKKKNASKKKKKVKSENISEGEWSVSGKHFFDY